MVHSGSVSKMCMWIIACVCMFAYYEHGVSMKVKITLSRIHIFYGKFASNMQNGLKSSEK